MKKLPARFIGLVMVASLAGAACDPGPDHHVVHHHYGPSHKKTYKAPKTYRFKKH